MFKRLVSVVAVALPVALAIVVGGQLLQGWNPFTSSASARRAAQFEEVLRLIHTHYVREADTDYDKLSDRALDGLLRSLDPHSEFLSKREFNNFKQDTSQEFGGIGVQIEVRERRLTVVAPIGGTPGERAGLLRGDQFVQVDGKDVEPLTLDDCLGLLRGKPGTSVDLTVYRPRTAETLRKTITREIIKVGSVRDVRLLTPEIGYVRILQFGERTGREFLAGLESLEARGMKALVLDLRDNPGGLLTVAVEVAQPFFNKGELVVYTEGRAADSRDNIRAEATGPRRAYPVAVLINSGSASASEIVAGALRDTNRAVLVGEKSFGKGSVQSILSLRGGEAIRLTTALYHLPSGDVIHGKGIEPHIPVTLTVEDDRKLAIQRNRGDDLSPEEFRERFEFDPIEDRQLSAAVDALRGVAAFSAP